MRTARTIRKKRVARAEDWKGPKYREVTDKPPWDATRAGHHTWMIDWVCSRLADIEHENQQDGAAAHEDGIALMASAEQWLEHKLEAKAISAARDYGDIEPLRSMYPSIAEFIHLPARADHSNYKKRPDHATNIRRERLELAVAEAELIRDIWQHHYGRRNRPTGPSTAAAIAASRHDLTEGEVTKKRVKKR